MSFVIESINPETVVVRLGKSLDFRNADEFKEVCREKVRAGARNFILDFSETHMLDSTALGAIFSVYRQIWPDDGQIFFASVTGSVKWITELIKLFRHFPSVEAARAALGEQTAPS